MLKQGMVIRETLSLLISISSLLLKFLKFTIEDLVVLLLFQELSLHSPTLMQKGLHASFHSQFTMEMTSTHVSIHISY